jgi:hypothetical protein
MPSIWPSTFLNTHKPESRLAAGAVCYTRRRLSWKHEILKYLLIQRNWQPGRSLRSWRWTAWPKTLFVSTDTTGTSEAHLLQRTGDSRIAGSSTVTFHHFTVWGRAGERILRTHVMEIGAGSGKGCNASKTTRRVLLEKLTVPQPLKKFPTFYVIRMFITALTTARQVALSWSDQSSPRPQLNLLKTRFNIILSSTPRSSKWYLFTICYIFMKFGIRFIYMKLSRRSEYRSYRLSGSHTLCTGGNQILSVILRNNQLDVQFLL